MMKSVLVLALLCCLFTFCQPMKRANKLMNSVARLRRQTTGLLDCGGNYTAPTGYFHTPGFPLTYPFNTVCKWHITVPPPYINIKFEFIPVLSIHKVELSNGTEYCIDNVQVHDGDSETENYKAWCGFGTTPPTISSGRSLYVKFTSGSLSGLERGFIAVYTGLKADGTTDCVALEKMSS